MLSIFTKNCAVNSRTFPPCGPAILYQLKPDSWPSAFSSHLSASCFHILVGPSDTACEWDYTVFVLLAAIILLKRDVFQFTML